MKGLPAIYNPTNPRWNVRLDENGEVEIILNETSKLTLSKYTLSESREEGFQEVYEMILAYSEDAFEVCDPRKAPGNNWRLEI